MRAVAARELRPDRGFLRATVARDDRTARWSVRWSQLKIRITWRLFVRLQVPPTDNERRQTVFPNAPTVTSASSRKTLFGIQRSKLETSRRVTAVCVGYCIYVKWKMTTKKLWTLVEQTLSERRTRCGQNLFVHLKQKMELASQMLSTWHQPVLHCCYRPKVAKHQVPTCSRLPTWSSLDLATDRTSVLKTSTFLNSVPCFPFLVTNKKHRTDVCWSFENTGEPRILVCKQCLPTMSVGVCRLTWSPNFAKSLRRVSGTTQQ